MENEALISWHIHNFQMVIVDFHNNIYTTSTLFGSLSVSVTTRFDYNRSILVVLDTSLIVIVDVYTRLL